MKKTAHSIIRLLAIVSLLMICSQAQAITKRALLVGISDYGASINASSNQWSNIHGANDVELVSKTLKLQGFRITSITNKNATARRIRKELKSISSSCRKGDVVYIHLSCHGQPFEDKNGDEEDGWDESFVPFDAHLYYEQNVYSGNKHLTDDILNTYLIKIRKKIGEHGILYVTIDACHAGNSYRDSEEDIYRGTGKGFSKNNKIYKVPKTQKRYFKIDDIRGYSPIVMLEACQSHQRNTEIYIKDTYYGPLTYAIYKTLQTKNIDKQAKWTKDLDSTMQDLLPSWNRQKMVVECSIK